MKPADFSRALKSSMDQDDIMDIFIGKMTMIVKSEMIPLRNLFDELKREMASGDAVADLQATINCLWNEIKAKDEKILALENKVGVLESSIDDLEQYSRRNSLRLHGVPEVRGEDSMEVALEVINKNLNLSTPLTVQELDRLHRVGPFDESAEKPRAVLIKFATYHSRQRVYSKRREFFKAGNNGPRYYLNEDLTKRRAQILSKARSLKRHGKLLGAWSVDGRMFIQDTGRTIRPIRSISDLDRYEAATTLAGTLAQPSAAPTHPPNRAASSSFAAVAATSVS